MTIAEKLRKEGKIQGKQQVLIRQLSKKYSLTEEDSQHIYSITDPDKLDAALDGIVVAESKEQVLNQLE